MKTTIVCLIVLGANAVLGGREKRNPVVGHGLFGPSLNHVPGTPHGAPYITATSHGVTLVAPPMYGGPVSSSYSVFRPSAYGLVGPSSYSTLWGPSPPLGALRGYGYPVGLSQPSGPLAAPSWRMGLGLPVAAPAPIAAPAPVPAATHAAAPATHAAMRNIGPIAGEVTIRGPSGVVHRPAIQAGLE